MSSNFSANQYETAFNPQRLQNYEVPSKRKERPSPRKGYTVIIADDRGHLKPKVHRSTDSPWGSFVGTWQMSRPPIQLRTRTRLMSHLAKIDRANSRSLSCGQLRPDSNNQGGSKCTSPNLSKDKQDDRHDQVTTSPQRPASENGSRPGTSTESIQGSASSRVPSSQGLRPQSQANSSRAHSPSGSGPHSHAQSAVVRSPSPQTPQSGLRASSAQPMSRGSADSCENGNVSRPESRMAESRTQSPLGSHHGSRASSAGSHLRSTTAGSVVQRAGLDSAASQPHTPDLPDN